METNKRHCKNCGELKVRIENGKYPDGKNKRYIDEEGKHWSGNTCAQCQIKKSKEIMRKARFKKQLETEHYTKEEV